MEGSYEPDGVAGRPLLTLEDLERWEEHGATWRMLEVDDEHAVVELCTCYGEPVDLVRGEAPELIEFIRGRLH
jgi:hypothetical protein